MVLSHIRPAQVPIPTKMGQVFVIDDYNNKVTQSDMGFNYFGGNTGATECPEGTTSTELSKKSKGLDGGSLKITFDFSDVPSCPGNPPLEPFAGYFSSLFGLTDTKVSLGGDPSEPSNSTPFPGYFLDFLNIFSGSQFQPYRSVEKVQFDVRRLSDEPIILKIELTQEKDDPSNPNEAPHRVFTRRAIEQNRWRTISLELPDSSGSSDFNRGDTASFDPHRVSLLSFIVERRHVADGVTNPLTGAFLIDNIRLKDVDGIYPNLSAARNKPQFTQAFLEHVRATSFQYFVDFASTDPRTGGIVQDRSTFADLMTTGGAGFQLTAYAIGGERGYLRRDDAAARALAILQVLDQNQGPEPVDTTGYQGFFYHFLGINGRRKQNFDFDASAVNESLNTVELSTIDTALAIAGVLTVRQFFDGNTADEAQIRSLADRIYARVNWDFMLDDQRFTNSNQFFLGWKPDELRDDDSGQFGRFKLDDPNGPGQYSSKIVNGQERPATLDFYTDEAVLVALLAMGSPNCTQPPPNRPRSCERTVWDSIERQGDQFVKTFPGALFTYQFSSVWLDTRALGSDSHPRRVNFFDNTRAAIRATRRYAIDNPNGRETWRHDGGANLWGLSATEGPFDLYFAEAAPTAALGKGGRSGSVVLEAEGSAATGDGQQMFREHASGGKTIQLDTGESRTFTFETFKRGLFFVSVRYSNDNSNTMPNERLQVSVDGVSLREFEAKDTGDGGLGWDVFESSGDLGKATPSNGPVRLRAGTHQLVVSVSGGDGGGIEIDAVTAGYERPLELGTATVYGAGSSIVHTPREAIRALWENEHMGLLHPRFGFADAFNLDVQDAVTGFIDPSDPRILRTHGRWANFTGFAIDHGPMLILIDNYLEHEFVPSRFMSHPCIHAVLSQLFPQANLPSPTPGPCPSASAAG